MGRGVAARDVQGRWRIVAMDLWDVDIFFLFGDDSGFRAVRDATAR